MERIIFCANIIAASFCFYVVGHNLDSSHEQIESEMAVVECIMTENHQINSDFALYAEKMKSSIISDSELSSLFPDDANSYNYSNDSWNRWPLSDSYTRVGQSEMDKISKELKTPSDNWCCENPIQKHIDKDGVIELSDMFFNDNMDACIVELLFHCGYACSYRTIRRYIESNGAWQLDKEIRITGV